MRPKLPIGKRLARALPFPGLPGAEKRIAKALIARANAERDRKNHRVAAVLYEEALRLRPNNAGVRVQCGHMFKEAGDLVQAEAHYLRAQELLPEDADLALQLGHFYKIAGRSDACEAAYQRAAALKPGWAEPLAELARLGVAPAEPAGAAQADDAAVHAPAPELLPRRPDDLRRSHVESIHVRQLGSRRERAGRGRRSTLRGVEAIRGFCISAEPIDQIEISLDGRLLAREATLAFDLEAGSEGRRKFVFNVWADLSGWAQGPSRIELAFLAGGRKVLSHRENVLIAPPLSEADHPQSDAVVNLPAGDRRPVEAQINARPSMVRPARRSILPSAPRNILVVRADQLGDMVVSAPAVRRLRELFPQARLVGLLTAANAAFAQSAKLFDEIVEIDFPEDPLERRRTMTAEAQEALRHRLEPYGFDIALDMAEVSGSRPLLLLSGARLLYGFHDHDWPWLDAGFEGQTRDPRNGLEMAAQSTKSLALVERLGATLNSRAKVERRPELRREDLAGFGVGAGERYALLHGGARLEFSRWPGLGELAARLLEETDLKVLLLSDGPFGPLPAGLQASERLRLIEDRLPFDRFDTLISFAEVFVGNDSGPKHLAALRGVETISIHSSRINWNEWGQELTGFIVSRRVPCAGCAISHDPEECGKDFACIRRVSVDEVLTAVLAALGRKAADG